MANWKLKGLRGEQRRRFLKLMGLAAAGVGLERSGFLNYLADQAGSETADAVADAGLFLAVPGPNGVQAWFEMMWPPLAMAVKATGSALNNATNQAMVTGSVSNSQNLAFLPWLYTPQHGYTETSVAGMAPFNKGNAYPGQIYKEAYEGARPFIYGPDAAFFDFNANKPKYALTAIMSGRDETHTDRPIS
jgi:hypothetical protein